MNNRSAGSLLPLIAAMLLVTSIAGSVSAADDADSVSAADDKACSPYTLMLVRTPMRSQWRSITIWTKRYARDGDAQRAGRLFRPLRELHPKSIPTICRIYSVSIA
jgi:hypothetical protein